MRLAIIALPCLAVPTTAMEAFQPWPPQQCTITQVGCYDDHDRIMGKNPQVSDGGRMTPEFCAGVCRTRGFGKGTYYGVEDGDQCFCAKTMKEGAQKVADTDCNLPCAADPSIKCGGAYRINIFQATCTNSTMSSALSACVARCEDAGHCCLGTISSYRNPSCMQGCLVADMEMGNIVAGSGGNSCMMGPSQQCPPGPKTQPPKHSKMSSDQALAQCKQVCTQNSQENNGNQCNWQGVKYADFTNCGDCGYEMKGGAWYNNGQGSKCGQDGANGRLCIEGCGFYFDPHDPVCGEGKFNDMCLGISANPAKTPALRRGQPLDGPADCDKQTCTDWESCTVWCQTQSKSTHGCCNWDDSQKQCAYVAGGKLASKKDNPPDHNMAALCAPFIPHFGGGGKGGVTGGGVFLILFFVGGMSYFAAGFVWNVKRNGVDPGVGAIPHKEFWKDLPFLVKDGVFFFGNRVKSLRDGYSSV